MEPRSDIQVVADDDSTGHRILDNPVGSFVNSECGRFTMLRRNAKQDDIVLLLLGLHILNPGVVEIILRADALTEI